MQFTQITALVADDFQAVNALLLRSLQSKASIINDLGNYIINSGGKRLRPLLVLLSARALGCTNHHPITLATAIECIHTATLLHDDVVDNADCRRGHKTANALWGNEAAILVGDFLYSKAFQLLTQGDNLPILQVLSDATNHMAEGEALQLLERHCTDTTETQYFDIIRAKTGKLFEASAWIGALIANAEPCVAGSLAAYGLHLGTAFQIVDDLLDYETHLQTGKNPGIDLAEGKLTLPLIYALQQANANDVESIKQAIRAGGKESLLPIREILHANGALEYAQRCASLEIEKAQQALGSLTASPYQDALRALATFALKREY